MSIDKKPINPVLKRVQNLTRILTRVKDSQFSQQHNLRAVSQGSGFTFFTIVQGKTRTNCSSIYIEIEIDIGIDIYIHTHILKSFQTRISIPHLSEVI